MAKNKLILGIEIECAYNPEKVDLGEYINNYHNTNADGWITPNWVGENDGSLHASKSGWETIEIISRPFLITEFVTIMQDLVDNVFKGKIMKDTMEINSSCGNHVHVSVLKEDNTTGTIPFRGRTFRFAGKIMPVKLTLATIKKIREEVLARLTPTARDRYFRDYATKIVKSNFFSGQKYREWNNSFRDGHAEYRSLNFVGVNTWTNLRRAYERIFTILRKYLIKEPAVETYRVSGNFTPTELPALIECKIQPPEKVENIKHKITPANITNIKFEGDEKCVT